MTEATQHMHKRTTFLTGHQRGVSSLYFHNKKELQKNASVSQKKWSSPHSQQKSPKCSTCIQSQKLQNDLSSFPRQTIQCNSNPIYALTVMLKKLKLNDSMKTYKTFQKLHTKKRCPFHYKGLAYKSKKEIPYVTGTFRLGVQSETGQRLVEFYQDNTLVIANTLFKQHKRRIYTWTSPDGQY